MPLSRITAHLLIDREAARGWERRRRRRAPRTAGLRTTSWLGGGAAGDVGMNRASQVLQPFNHTRPRAIECVRRDVTELPRSNRRQVAPTIPFFLLGLGNTLR